MKVKKFTKKMNLNKKTIAHLNNGAMNALNGGIGTIRETTPCDLCETYEECTRPAYCETEIARVCESDYTWCPTCIW